MFSVKKLALHAKQLLCHFRIQVIRRGRAATAWRGAAFSGGSSIALQQAAPGNDPRRSFYSERFVRRESSIDQSAARDRLGGRRSVTEYGELRGGFREPPAANR